MPRTNLPSSRHTILASLLLAAFSLSITHAGAIPAEPPAPPTPPAPPAPASTSAPAPPAPPPTPPAPASPPVDQDPDQDDAARPAPVMLTALTRADPAALAALQAPGEILFQDGFESADSFNSYFEVRGRESNLAAITTDPAIAHSGAGALRLTSPDNHGSSSGAGVEYWFGPDGFDRIHLRAYIRFAADYDQGNLNHTGPCLSGVAGNNKWGGMGTAGLRPRGDDNLSTRLEPWTDWGRQPAPGSLHLYTYWMDMRRDKDGHYWGNMLMPDAPERIIPARDRWYCLEEMISLGTPGEPDGELAAWVDGALYLHCNHIRWRSDAALRLKRFSLIVYVHQARRSNTVWYDDVAISTGYIGPMKSDAPNDQPPPAAPAPDKPADAGHGTW